MRGERIGVTAELVCWARKHAGFTLEEARRRFPNIEMWEAGTDSPTYPQLETLAEAFKVPVAVFFFPEPPDVPPVSRSFRTIPETEFNRLPSRIRQLVNGARALQLALGELQDGVSPAPRKILHDIALSSDDSIPRMAASVRAWLDVPISVQTSWSDSDEALEEWRFSLRKAGIAVFKDAFRLDDFSGFCLYDREFPLIYVNNSKPRTRQIFTLFHELAHLLLQTSGVDPATEAFLSRLPPDNHATEILCNRFASEFLLPNSLLEHLIRGKPADTFLATELAERYHVSREVVFRRFLDRGLIASDMYTAAAGQWKREQRSGDGGNWYYNQIAYLGMPYINLVFSRFYQNRIDEVQAADYLNIKPARLAELETYVVRRSG